ncbi:uncharacterized protein VTP21DRAFT_467 [Calcarisporiella thermophila]|uniref:uncharacterized protein n=1 Tax=Calcarisporiella thermophila TaxID=911321 RepID=UPI00374423B1
MATLAASTRSIRYHALYNTVRTVGTRRWQHSKSHNISTSSSHFITQALERASQRLQSWLPISALSQSNTQPPTRNLTNTGQSRSWAQAVRDAESILYPEGEVARVNPLQIVGKDMEDLKTNVIKLLGSGHPVLNTLSKYYFNADGKRIRPLLVLLMSQATSIAPKAYQVAPTEDFRIIDTPISAILTQQNDQSTPISTDANSYTPSVRPDGCTILPSQRRLAEITEMIHTASLLHDDVIDNAETRRKIASANMKFGNKMAILAGDFLLARASLALARLRHPEVTELLATVIANLVEGEFMQLKNTGSDGEAGGDSTFEHYMKKNYMKTASLIAKSCHAATVLGGSTQEIAEVAYTYGRNVGIAFQLVDDVLDFVSSADEFGKPVNADLQLGIATAPVLYAWEEFPELEVMIKRNFEKEGDVEKAREYVMLSNGIEQTRKLAALHCNRAIEAVMQLPPSDARTALVQLAENVLTRKN